MPPQSHDEVRAGLLTLEVEQDGDTRRIRLAGELDLANAATLDAELSAALSDGACSVVMDMRELTFIDSTGIAIVVAALNRDADGTQLRFLPSRAPAVTRVLQLTGVEERLPLDGAV